MIKIGQSGLLVLVALSTACGGASTTFSDKVVGSGGDSSIGSRPGSEAGEAGEAGALGDGEAGETGSAAGSAGDGGLGSGGSKNGGAPGLAGSGSVPGTSGAPGTAGSASGGSASGGSAGAAGGSAGAAGSGSASSAGASGSGSAGSAGATGNPYECSAPVNLTTEETYSCVKKVCSNLGYQCGTIGTNACSSGQTVCGIPVSNLDCSDYLNACPLSTFGTCADHKCVNPCIRVKVTNPASSTCAEPTDVGNIPGGKAYFRYQCGMSDPDPGDPDPSTCAPNGSTVCGTPHCHPDTGHGSSTWCCDKNENGCMVRIGSPASGPGVDCNNRPYIYEGCLDSPNTSMCSKMPSGYCCSSPNL